MYWYDWFAQRNAFAVLHHQLLITVRGESDLYYAQAHMEDLGMKASEGGFNSLYGRPSCSTADTAVALKA